MANEEIAPKPPEGPPKPNGEGRAAGVTRDYIAVARGSDLIVIRVVGMGTMLTASALSRFAEQQRQAGFRRFVFDLERCRGLDSTFLGVMVGMEAALDDAPAEAAAPGSSGDRQPISKQPEIGVSPRWPGIGVRPRWPATNLAATPLTLHAATAGPEGAGQMSPDEAVAALRTLFASPAAAAAELAHSGDGQPISEGPLPLLPPAAGRGLGVGVSPRCGGMVSAINVPPDIANLMAMLGVDRFVKVRGAYDLRPLEMTILADKNLPREEQHRLILEAHDALIEIDKRNEARFGPFLKSLSQALAE